MCRWKLGYRLEIRSQQTRSSVESGIWNLDETETDLFCRGSACRLVSCNMRHSLNHGTLTCRSGKGHPQCGGTKARANNSRQQANKRDCQEASWVICTCIAIKAAIELATQSFAAWMLPRSGIINVAFPLPLGIPTGEQTFIEIRRFFFGAPAAYATEQAWTTAAPSGGPWCGQILHFVLRNL
eukprot:COSAG05_NODE_673_length_7989_cov_2.973638_4_plen_183_part_00